MPQRLSLILLILCGVLGTLTETAFPTPTEEAYQRGYDAYRRRDFATALREWQSLAQQGYPAAQYRLGYMHKWGEGVAQNAAEAVKWYRKAADQGNHPAQNDLGDMYVLGWGVAQGYRKPADQGYANRQASTWRVYKPGPKADQDVAEAVKWYRKAADQGNVNGQVSLGSLYEKGRGVTQNYAEAAQWYRKAADQGYANSPPLSRLLHRPALARRPVPLSHRPNPGVPWSSAMPRILTVPWPIPSTMPQTSPPSSAAWVLTSRSTPMPIDLPWKRRLISLHVGSPAAVPGCFFSPAMAYRSTAGIISSRLASHWMRTVISNTTRCVPIGS